MKKLIPFVAFVLLTACGGPSNNDDDASSSSSSAMNSMPGLKLGMGGKHYNVTSTGEEIDLDRFDPAWSKEIEGGRLRYCPTESQIRERYTHDIQVRKAEIEKTLESQSPQKKLTYSDQAWVDRLETQIKDYERNRDQEISVSKNCVGLSMKVLEQPIEEQSLYKKTKESIEFQKDEKTILKCDDTMFEFKSGELPSGLTVESSRLSKLVDSPRLGLAGIRKVKCNKSIAFMLSLSALTQSNQFDYSKATATYEGILGQDLVQLKEFSGSSHSSEKTATGSVSRSGDSLTMRVPSWDEVLTVKGLSALK